MNTHRSGVVVLLARSFKLLRKHRSILSPVASNLYEIDKRGFNEGLGRSYPTSFSFSDNADALNRLNHRNSFVTQATNSGVREIVTGEASICLNPIVTIS